MSTGFVLVHLEAAQTETQVSIYSPPFYSSPTGYKMCLRLYLNGDGSARRTHVSLFFVLMRGSYDAILTFPFCFNIVFCLLDQSDSRKHIIEIFRPDVTSNSFQRPRSDMNIASGLSKFVPLSVLQQENGPYVRDDTIFIKTLVNFADLPDSIIPNVIDINPALAASSQHTLIQQELEKYRQQTSRPASEGMENI